MYHLQLETVGEDQPTEPVTGQIHRTDGNTRSLPVG